MRRTPILLKLGLTLAVPILVLAIATTLGVRSASGDRAEVRRQTELARAAIGPAGLLTTLQNERLWVATDLIGTDDATHSPVESYEEAHSQTDAARTALEQQLASGDEVIVEAFAGPLGGLGDLAQLRADVDAFRATSHDTTGTIEFGAEIWRRYTDLVTPFFDATTHIAGDIEDAQLRAGARLSDIVARGIEAFTQAGQRTVTIALLTDEGVDTRDEIGELSRLSAHLARYAEAIESARPPYDDLPSLPGGKEMIAGVNAQTDEAITTGRVRLDEFIAAVDKPTDEGLYALRDDVHSIINTRADKLEDQAAARQTRLLTLALLGMAFVVVLNLLVSRSITRPLRSLTRQAKEVAQRRLPAAVQGLLDVPVGADMPVPQIEPVTVDAGDELAAVAGALNTVQTSVVDLAARQAVYRRNISDLFVSLNGRNQELLRRQLGLLGQLDTPVATPTARASLSQVDHLATQMRRNTESLLAVAGVDARRVWQAPVDVTEVVGYALGEVSDTRRTVVHDLEPAAIAGAAAGDLVHLLAELIETSLEFSAHERRPIEVRGGAKHETGGYWLAIIDFGAVLTPREVQVVNQQLSGGTPPPSSNGASPPAPALAPGLAPALAPGLAPAPVAGPGHAVAGQLAKRAGVAVRLDSSAGWGVTVTVDIPGDLVVRRLSENHEPLAFGPPPVTSAPPLPRTAMAPGPPPTLRDSYR